MRKHLIAAAALAALVPAPSSANTAAVPAANAADPAANAMDPAMADPAANAAVGTEAVPMPTDPAATDEGSDLALRGTENRRQTRDGFPWGLLGLIGLAGLIPRKRRNPNDA